MKIETSSSRMKTTLDFEVPFANSSPSFVAYTCMSCSNLDVAMFAAFECDMMMMDEGESMAMCTKR